MQKLTGQAAMRSQGAPSLRREIERRKNRNNSKIRAGMDAARHGLVWDVLLAALALHVLVIALYAVASQRLRERLTSLHTSASAITAFKTHRIGTRRTARPERQWRQEQS